MEDIGRVILEFISDNWFELLLVVIFLMLSAFFSGSETALYSIDRFRKEKLALNKSKKHQYTKKLLDSPNELLVTILFGNMVVNIFLSTIVDNLLLGANEIIAIAVSTFIILIFGEVFPKIVSINNSWKLALIVSKYLYYFSLVITPFRIVLYRLSKFFSNVFTSKDNEGEGINNEISDKDLKSILNMAVGDGVIPKDEAHLIENVFNFAEFEARNVMTPRINVFALPEDISITKLLFEAKRNKFSKIPIYKDNLDNITGLIYLKDLIPYYHKSKDEKKELNIRMFTRKIHSIPEMKPLKSVLQDFIKLKINIAVVIDEYGGTEGIITLNDIIEQILGRFIDKDDDDNTRLVTKITDDKYIVLGECTLSEFNKLTDIHINDDDSETIAGYVLKKFNKIPEKGEIVKDNENIFEIKSIIQNKIEQIIVIKGSKIIKDKG